MRRMRGVMRTGAILAAATGLLFVFGCNEGSGAAGEMVRIPGVEDLSRVDPLALVGDAHDRVVAGLPPEQAAGGEPRLGRINIIGVRPDGTVDLTDGDRLNQVHLVFAVGDFSWSVHYIALPGGVGPLVDVAPAIVPLTAPFPDDVVVHLRGTAAIATAFSQAVPNPSGDPAETACTYFMDAQDRPRAVFMAGDEVRAFDALTGAAVDLD